MSFALSGTNFVQKRRFSTIFWAMKDFWDGREQPEAGGPTKNFEGFPHVNHFTHFRFLSENLSCAVKEILLHF